MIGIVLWHVCLLEPIWLPENPTGKGGNPPAEIWSFPALKVGALWTLNPCEMKVRSSPFPPILSEIIRKHPKIIQNHPKSSKDHPESSKIIRNHRKSSEIIQSHPEPSKDHPKSMVLSVPRYPKEMGWNLITSQPGPRHRPRGCGQVFWHWTGNFWPLA